MWMRIEIAMGRAAHERLVDLELSKTDLAEIAPQDARRAAEQGVRVSASQPDELLALVFVGGNTAPNAATAASAARPQRFLAKRPHKRPGQRMDRRAVGQPNRQWGRRYRLRLIALRL